jgi:hypothetical protein
MKRIHDQELLGDKSMSMVLRYAHLSQEHKKKAVNLSKGFTTTAHKNEPASQVSQKKDPVRLSLARH